MSALTIVGIGAKTPLGLNAVQTGFLLRAGFPAMGQSPIAALDGEPVAMSTVSTIDLKITGARRLPFLAKSALEEASVHLKNVKTEVIVCTDLWLTGNTDAVTALSAMVHDLFSKLSGSTPSISVVAGGEAGLVAALPAVQKTLDTRKADAVVIGGVHTDHDPDRIVALDKSGRLFSRDNLDAKVPGESAAFITLMRDVEASGKSVPRLADIVGYGMATDQASPDKPPPAMSAQALTAAVRHATTWLREEGRTAGWLWTDLTTEMDKIHEWGATFVRSHEVLGKPYYVESPAQRIGYLGAAALPLFAATTSTAWMHGYGPSDVALGIAGADSGERAALLLKKVRTVRG